MKKHIFNEQTGISYTLHGDYYLPDLKVSNEEDRSIGISGKRHFRYIKQHKGIFYTTLITSGKLNSYLADIDEQAKGMFFQLVKQMAEQEGVTEKLKAENQMEWVCRMNNIRSRATEIVNNDLIYR